MAKTPITIKQLVDASEDAISLEEFVYKPADYLVKRRLAPDTYSLQHYIDNFNAVKNEQSNQVVAMNNEIAKVVPMVESAIEGVAIDANLVTDALIKTVPISPDAIARNQAAKNREITSIRDFSSLDAALSSSDKFMLFAPNDKVSMSSDKTVPSGKILSGRNATLIQETDATLSLKIPSLSKNTVITDLNFEQPTTAPISGGTDNNHFQISVSGSKFTAAIRNVFRGQYGYSSGYGAITMPDKDRRGMHNLVLANAFDGIQGMAIQNIGGSTSIIVANAADSSGSRGAGTRAAYHGIRLAGYDRRDTTFANNDGTDMRCVGVVGTANVIKGFNNAISAQNAASKWSISDTYAEDCSTFILFTPTPEDNVAVAPRLGRISGVGNKITNPIVGYTYHHCNFDLILDGSEVTDASNYYYVNEENPTGEGKRGGDSVKLTIFEPPQGGMQIRRSNSSYDLQISKTNGTALQTAVDTKFNSIRASINNVGGSSSGAIIRGAYHDADLKISNVNDSTKNALHLLANNSSINIVTDGNVLIEGSNNIVSGIVTGKVKVSASASANSITGIQGFKNCGTSLLGTDALGVVKIPHGLRSEAAGIVTTFTHYAWSGAVYFFRLKAIQSNMLEVFVYNADGTAAANVPSVPIKWSAVANTTI